MAIFFAHHLPTDFAIVLIIDNYYHTVRWIFVSDCTDPQIIWKPGPGLAQRVINFKAFQRFDL